MSSGAAPPTTVSPTPAHTAGTSSSWTSISLRISVAVVVVLYAVLFFFDPYGNSTRGGGRNGVMSIIINQTIVVNLEQKASANSHADATTSVRIQSTTDMRTSPTNPNRTSTEVESLANLRTDLSDPQRVVPPLQVQWSSGACYPQSELLKAKRIVQVAAVHCPWHLPAEVLKQYQEEQQQNEATAPSSPSTSRQLLGIDKKKRAKKGGGGGGGGGDPTPGAPGTTQEERTANFDAVFATPVCGTLNYTTCGFIRQGKFFFSGGNAGRDNRAKGGLPTSTPYPYQFDDAHPGLGVLPQRMAKEKIKSIEQLLETSAQQGAASSSGFSRCQVTSRGQSQPQQVGLLNQRIRAGDGVTMEFSLTRRTSTSAADKTNQTAMNTIQWLHWEQLNVNTTCSSSLPPLSARPQPSAYRNSLEILQTIRSFHKARLAAEQRTCSSALTSPPKILFSGDSIMRHLFFRLAFLLRGEEVIPHDHPRRRAQNGGPALIDKPIMEQYLHGDVVYRLFDDGVDEFEVMKDMIPYNLKKDQSWRLNAFNTVEDYMSHRKSNAHQSKVVLELHFVWDIEHTKHSRMLSTKYGCIGAGYSLHVHAANYFKQQPDLDGYVQQLMGNNRVIQGGNATVGDESSGGSACTPNIEKCGAQSITVFATELPQNNSRTAQLNEQTMTLAQKHERERVADAEGKTARKNKSRVSRNKNFFALDLAGIGEMFLEAFATNPQQLRCDNMHFMCTFAPRYPDAIMFPKPAYCPGNPCRDDVNAALVQILVDHLPLFSF